MTVTFDAQGNPIQPDPATQQPPNQPQPIVVNVPPPPPPTPTQHVLSPEEAMRLVEQARKEEKDKLYPQMEELKNQVSTLSKERDERLAAEQKAQAEEEERQRKEQEEKMSVQELLNQQNQTWEERFAQMAAERDAERALREKEVQYSQLNEYRLRRIQEESENIVPQLADFVRGNTTEEIEASITQVKDRSAQIVADVQNAQLQRRQQVPLPATSGPPIDMAGIPENTRTLSAQDIANMDIEEYASIRSQLLGAAGERVRTQGVYAP